MTAAGHLAALLGLPRLGLNRLEALLAAFGDAEAAWHAVRRGRLDGVGLWVSLAERPKLVDEWRAAAASVDVDDIVRRHRDAGVTLLHPGHPSWPAAFDDDPERPHLLFAVGDLDLLTVPAVAVVGTRRCTAAGAAIARDLGHDLALAGLGVVSGLALGIDGAAHRGSLRGGGPTLGVVATGVDVVYPRRHAELWAEVGASGLLLSEAPLGTPAERWRFPSRNRLIAALSRLVVVVESGTTGGSMSTVEAAVKRGIDVMAVPGSVRSPASAGPNQLIVEGCGVVRDATDVLLALGAVAVPASGGAGDVAVQGSSARPPDDPVARAVSSVPASLEELVAATGLPFTEVAARLASLEVAGLVERRLDGYQRVIP